jgi:phosphotransferase system enzyme I (PtsP)
VEQKYKKNNVDMICSVGELAALFEHSRNIDDFLQQAVSIVARHMNAGVCSIYLLDEKTDELMLQATEGLSTDSIGQVRLHVGEGITGTALKELRPIREGRGSENPHFKFVPGILEENYEAFLAVPILRGLKRIGVLVVQHAEPDFFTDNDVKALRAIAAQLATTIENAQLLISLQGKSILHSEKNAASSQPRRLRGKPASPGIAQGQAFILGDQRAMQAAAQEVAAKKSLAEFERALSQTEEQLNQLQRQTEEQLGEMAGLIFSAQLLMLKDHQFAGAMSNTIGNDGLNPVQAIEQQVNHYVQLFDRSENPRLREKVQDIRDLEWRLLTNLSGTQTEHPGYNGKIIIARNLLPSDTLKYAVQGAAGLVLLSGGMTSHVAILAGSLELPMIICRSPFLMQLEGTPEMLLDANVGNIFINPTEEIKSRYRALMHPHPGAAARQAAPAVHDKTFTNNGLQIHLMANINLISDLKTACDLKAEGIGLYRSEFPFLIRNDFPTEEEQYCIYRKITESMPGRPVNFRTLDIGGDKMLSYYSHVDETNPFLGLRAIRFSLRNRDIFSQQLRALLRAGHDSDLRIMFPLISSLDDFMAARSVVEECLAQLESEATPFNNAPLLGVMVELPSAVEIIEELADAADFLSIGSNDLVQYMLAVDRTNEHLTDWYVYHHPAVLRAIQKTVHAAESHGIPVSICGDMASREQLLPFLVGCGLRAFSMNAYALPRVQRCIQNMDSEQARQLAQKVLNMARIDEIAEAMGIE